MKQDEAIAVLSNEYDSGHISAHSADTQIKGILKAVRVILRTGEGQSILERATTVMRRHDDMANQLGHKYP